MTIYKVQRPIFSSDPEALGEVLVYDERGIKHTQIPMTHELEALFGDRFKIYVEADIEEDGAFVFKNLVDDQNW